LAYYIDRKKIRDVDLGHVDDLARAGLITKNLDFGTLKMTAQTTLLGRDLLRELLASKEVSKKIKSAESTIAEEGGNQRHVSGAVVAAGGIPIISWVSSKFGDLFGDIFQHL